MNGSLPSLMAGPPLIQLCPDQREKLVGMQPQQPDFPIRASNDNFISGLKGACALPVNLQFRGLVPARLQDQPDDSVARNDAGTMLQAMGAYRCDDHTAHLRRNDRTAGRKGVAGGSRRRGDNQPVGRKHAEGLFVYFTFQTDQPGKPAAGNNHVVHRNALCSQRGYQRLTDTFHPDEFRQALFVDGFEVEPIDYATASEFTVTFNCKPQRFLSSGETKTSVPSGGTVTNPTLLESSPMLEFKGYGSITLGGQSINVDLVPMGDIIVSNGGNFALKNQETTSIHAPREIGHINIDVSNLNNGDKIYTGESSMTYNVNVPKWVGVISSVSVSNETGENWSTKSAIVSQYSAYFTTFIPSQTFSKGTASTKTYEYVLDWVGSGVTFGATMTIRLSYDGNQTVTLLASTMKDTNGSTYEFVVMIGQVNGNSTVVTTSTFYIDLDIGEAYFLKSGNYTSANYAVSIPAKLPKLAPGSNTITYSNTITNFKITPRWWKL